MKYGRWTVVADEYPYALCRCDCGTETKVLKQNLRNGRSSGCLSCRIYNGQNETWQQRFYRLRVKKHENTKDCWEFDGYINKGYGIVRYYGKTIMAHRASWIYHNGDIPSGMNVCHKCDNPICINPRHLFIGSQRENMLDMIEKNRSNYTRGKSHPSCILVENDIPRIFDMFHIQKMTKRAISKILEVSSTTIGKVLNFSHYLTRQY